jgi:hypothetical protein
MRWVLKVALVRWRRFSLRFCENSSSGVGLVRWCRIVSWDFRWEFSSKLQRNGPRCWGSEMSACSTVPALRVDQFGKHDSYSGAGCEYESMRTEVPRPALYPVGIP